MPKQLTRIILLILPIIFNTKSALSATDYKVPRRISGEIMDLGEVKPIYMVPGMATIIEIPSKVTDAIAGDVETIKFLPLGNSQNEVRLALTTGKARPTNLIIRSGAKKFVFDIIPSHSIHQDSIRVVSSYGGPELAQSRMTLIATSKSDEEEKKK